MFWHTNEKLNAIATVADKRHKRVFQKEGMEQADKIAISFLNYILTKSYIKQSKQAVYFVQNLIEGYAFKI